MIVRVYNGEQESPEALLAECNLHECFPADSRDSAGRSAFLSALDALIEHGRVIICEGDKTNAFLFVRHY